jgi:hypothetical protein
MLKLLAMLSTGNVLLALLLLISSLLQPAAGTSIYLLSPVEGDYLQGVVTVSGGMDVEGFLSYEVAFAYEGVPETQQSWFSIRRDVNQVQKGALALWDTTTITDGEYQLRVTVQMDGGKQVETVVRRLHVSNYSPIPAAVAPNLQAAPKGNLPAQVEVPAPVELPPNPAELTRDELKAGIVFGLVGVLILLAGLGVYAGLRRLLRKK